MQEQFIDVPVVPRTNAVPGVPHRSHITLAVERQGDTAAPPVVLIMGLAGQMIGWPDGLLAALQAQGLQWIRFDNRDAGRSTHLHDNPEPDLPAALRGDFSRVGYTLSDMASDVVGLLDALGLDSAHVVGASMGGAIGQTLAIEHPGRVRSLTSMMSTTGAPGVGQVHPEVFTAMTPVQAPTRDQVEAQTLAVFRVIGSPAYPTPEAEVRARAGRGFERAYDPQGTARQAVASVASGDRTAALAQLRLPVLVLHGRADRMCDVSGGEATAAAIPGAQRECIDGWGHDLPPGLWPRLAQRIGDFIAQVERQRLSTETQAPR